MQSRMPFKVCVLALGLFTCSLSVIGVAEELTRDNACKAIVFLSYDVPQKITLQGKEYEIWLRELGTDKPFPKMIQKSGTAFIVRYQNQNYLVTAKHVATDTSIDWSATISGPNDISFSYSFNNFTGYTNELPWAYHPVADVAVLRLLDDSEFYRSGKGHGFGFSIFVREPKAPSRDKVLTILGFPLGLGVQKKIAPFTRETKAASGLIQQGTNKRMVFYLSDPGVQGYSGAPIFDFPFTLGSALKISSGQTLCYGLISGTMPDDTGGKMAVVEPSSYICETILKAHEQAKNKTNSKPKIDPSESEKTDDDKSKEPDKS